MLFLPSNYLVPMLKPRRALNKAFLKVKPNRSDMERFKAQLMALLDSSNDTESEEFHKNLVSDFLKRSYYEGKHFINTKGRNDLVIHNGAQASSTVGVIIEAKKPTNKAEMPQAASGKLNSKALQELVLYYLRERITHKNLEVKHLIITNIYEWYLFDAQLFDRLFAQNKTLVKQFTEFEGGRLAETKTDFFYRQIAEPFIAGIQTELEFTYFNLSDYEKPLRNASKEDDTALIALFKVLSPEHLLKLPFANDSNSLDKRFYSELLHIIGLTETKEGGKKLIQRNKAEDRHTASLLEDAIIQLDSLDKLNRLDRGGIHFGTTTADRLFNVALELVITWVNRILFLKLLEAQLLSYHKGNKAYAFLSAHKIGSYDDLNSLFFQVLARRHEERNQDVQQAFAQVPYLNSSLFEPTELEQLTLFISNLRDDKSLPIHTQTVLKDEQGRKRIGSMGTLAYLFAFLEAYDFSSEGAEDIQEDNKTLINASVLGLIFEKINGYKDGSFFTPGFITMYMCRETIRKAVLQKFNETKGWDCADLDALYDKIDDRTEANAIVNSVKICDPAVGSGHFLVSALNEMLAVKNDLKILQDRHGRRLKEYQLEVVNDELIVTDEEGELFEYSPANKESQRIQETLFHEKQAIIENCLFGVDINPNSVKICRLRLWIELLKNAYYKNAAELETLPNIDINIKVGNSLVSRFAMDADLKQALRKSKWTMESYRNAVATYRNAENKEQKREMERLIGSIKSDFRSEIAGNDPKIRRLQKLEYDFGLLVAPNMFEESTEVYGSRDNKKKAKERETKMLAEINKLKADIEEIKSNKIYENAFEWRFEFPEVLNNEGDFVGFDVVIGNPPYGVKFTTDEKLFLKNRFKAVLGKFDSYGFFIEKGIELLKVKGKFGYIVPNTWLTVNEAHQTRDLIFERAKILEINKLSGRVFEDATVDTTNLILSKEGGQQDYKVKVISFPLDAQVTSFNPDYCQINYYSISTWVNAGSINLRIGPKEAGVIEKLKFHQFKFSDIFDFSVGVQAYDSYAGQTKEIIESRVYHSEKRTNDTFYRELNGSDVERYCLNPKKESWISYGNWLAHPRSPKYFFNPRILVREITSKGLYKIPSTYVEDDFVNYKSILNIISSTNNKEQLLIALGILNSALISWYFSSTSNKLESNSFPRISLLDLKGIPLTNNFDNCDVGKEILRHVRQIQSEKTLNPTADTTILEAQIDQLAYALYDLTEEEIKIVEGL